MFMIAGRIPELAIVHDNYTQINRVVRMMF